MNATQREALRDQFAVAVTQGYQLWRWARKRTKDGLPTQAVNEAIARDIWEFADLMLIVREATKTDSQVKFPPCPDCGWQTMPWGDKQIACFRCTKMFPRPVNLPGRR